MSITAAPRTASGARDPRPIAAQSSSQMQMLARRIQATLPSDQDGGHVVGVTSCSRREGVSVVAGNLAVCAADLYDGRVLLLDANLRNASVARRFGVDQSPGLYDCLTGELAVQECIAGTAHSNLFVLPAGLGATPPPHCSDERATALFGNLRQDFALIIFDLPPAAEMDEMILASRLVDGLLLVLESERIRRHVAQRVVRQLEQIDARLLGVVLNKRKNHIPEWLYRWL